ncbi:MAG: methyltransferase domain-containing protein [Spirochaetes bacterium]|nr:methyltransferase domain-containing protein [Spirochaetota bacterium]
MRHRKAEIDSLMEYLGSFELANFNADERSNYLNVSLDRFLKTLEVFPEGIGEKSRVLELGANPYFMSLLMRRRYGCHLDFANFFGDRRRAKDVEVLTSEQFGETYRFRFGHFNVERERFPYRDGSFDLVLFCEIIEHLTMDPVHPLVQINRILRDGGHVVITTPNVLRHDNLRKLIMGKNVHDHYSGYGPYGRHNREYTPAELRELVEALGFRVERLYTKVTGAVNIRGLSIKRFRGLIQLLTTRNRGSNIFMLARKVADARPVYPGWLFESMHETTGSKAGTKKKKGKR